MYLIITRYSSELRRMFLARLGFLGGIFQKMELACNYNLYNRSCLAVNREIFEIARKCPGYDAKKTSMGAFTYTLPEYSTRDSGAALCSDCSETVVAILREGHCCSSTELSIKKRLLNMFLPGKTERLEVDLSEFNCLVYQKCDGGWPSAGEVTLKTTAAECGNGLAPHLQCLSCLTSVYPWPVSCCQWHTCHHGGSRCDSSVRVHVLAWKHLISKTCMRL